MMKVYERHEIFPCHLEDFMTRHVGKPIIFREKRQEIICQKNQEIMCLDIVREMSKAEYNTDVLSKLLDDNTAGIVEEEKAAIEYAIECIKTLDDMGILKGDTESE